MSNSSSRRFPVTVTQLPVTRCEICQRTVAYRPGTLSEALTEHYHRPQLGAPADTECGRLTVRARTRTRLICVAEASLAP